MKKMMIVLIISLGLISCPTKPMRYTDKPLQAYDRDTQYRIDEVGDGFIVTIYYSRYQYHESSSVALACKSSLTSIAYEYAQKKNRDIKPINEQIIKISMGRNEWIGITSCSATVQVQYQERTK